MPHAFIHQSNHYYRTFRPPCPNSPTGALWYLLPGAVSFLALPLGDSCTKAIHGKGPTNCADMTCHTELLVVMCQTACVRHRELSVRSDPGPVRSQPRVRVYLSCSCSSSKPIWDCVCQAITCYPMDSASDVSVMELSSASVRTVKRLRIAMKLLDEFQALNLQCPPDVFEHITNNVPKRTWERAAGLARRLLQAERERQSQRCQQEPAGDTSCSSSFSDSIPSDRVTDDRREHEDGLA